MTGYFKKIFFFLFLLVIPFKSFCQYNFYFGTLHAHSAYSDGNKDSLTSFMTTPYQDFEYAKQSLNMHYLGISDHNHADAGMKRANYLKGIQQANLANVNGSFVCLYGMEWGEIATGGHVLIYGFDSLIGWESNNYDVYNAQNDYTSLFTKIANHPGAFAYLAHPTTTDFNGLYSGTYNPVKDKAIVGTPFRSGPAFSTNITYSDPSNGHYLNRFYDALKKGYHLGIGMDHDTHYSVFGRSQEGRTVVLANTLTQASILDAYSQMRYYASDDWNTRVNFTANTFPLGSIVTAYGNPALAISVVDPDMEAVSDISIFSGVPGSGNAPALLVSVAGSLSLNYTHVVNDSSTHYYFARIQQTDGDQIYTSPIWYTRFDAIGIAETSTSTISALSIHPNPIRDAFILSFTSEKFGAYFMEVYSASGNLVLKRDLGKVQGAFAQTVKLNDLPSGIYLVRISNEKVSQTLRMVKE